MEASAAKAVAPSRDGWEAQENIPDEPYARFEKPATTRHTTNSKNRLCFLAFLDLKFDPEKK
jgi:hypothetical protein